MLVLFILFTTALSSMFPDLFRLEHATLPSSTNGHSIFSTPPYSVLTDTVWTPPFDDVAMIAHRPFETQPSFAHDPPEKVETTHFSCFMQSVNVPSSFISGNALKALANVLPIGHQESVTVLVLTPSQT